PDLRVGGEVSQQMDLVDHWFSFTSKLVWVGRELPQPGGGVHQPAVPVDFEVQMRTGGQAGGAEAGDLLAGEDRLALGDQGLGEVAVERRQPAAVVEQDVDAAGTG